jgi:hypothetical protein
MNVELTKINVLLDKMKTISLGEMENIRLMDRIDSKFVAAVSLLPQLLEEMSPYFKVQKTESKPIAPYCTQYLDTPDLAMFVMHQNGKLNRQKIRIRSYVESNLSFLEIKNKNNKGRTSKMRVPISLSHLVSIDDLNEKKQFVEKNAMFSSSHLEPSLANQFQRITFVNNNATERVTIDINLSFANYRTGNKVVLDELMILELKQSGRQHSDFRGILNGLNIKPLSFSKYCMGIVLTDPDVKYNRFKSKWSTINKLIR